MIEYLNFKSGDCFDFVIHYINKEYNLNLKKPKNISEYLNFCNYLKEIEYPEPESLVLIRLEKGKSHIGILKENGNIFHKDNHSVKLENLALKFGQSQMRYFLINV